MGEEENIMISSNGRYRPGRVSTRRRRRIVVAAAAAATSGDWAEVVARRCQRGETQ